MVHIKKRIVSGKGYYYLEHNLDKEGKTITKSQYLGDSIPKNIEKLKKDFIFELNKAKWFGNFEKIKARYKKEQKITPPSMRTKGQEQFAVKFTYNTQRIEGSSLTLKETANLLERGISPNEKPIADALEAQAHNKVFFEMIKYEKDLSYQIVLYWHKKLFEQTKPDIVGKTRTHQVQISGSKFMPPMPAEIDILLQEFFEWYNKNKSTLNPVELAALTHLKFVTIHPFGDGNGRISRLIMNFVLHKHGYPMLDIPYEKRNSYYNALERSQVKKIDAPFLQWFFRRYIKAHAHEKFLG